MPEIDTREVGVSYSPGRFPRRRWGCVYEMPPEPGQDVGLHFSSCGHTVREAWRNLHHEVRLHYRALADAKAAYRERTGEEWPNA